MPFDHIWRNKNILKEPFPQICICSSTFNFWCFGCFMHCLYTVTQSLNLVLPTLISPKYSSKQPEQIKTKMTLKLLQDIRVFNVNVLFTFLNVYSLDSNNDSQHLHGKSWHFLTPISSLLNSTLVSSFWRLGGCCLLLISLIL